MSQSTENIQLCRESVDQYKSVLSEGLGRALGRGFGHAKNAARAVSNIPGVKPVVRTAAVAAGVAGGMYAYNNYIKPDSPQIEVPTSRKSYLPQQRTTETQSEPKKKKSRGSYSNTIVPVKQPKSSDFAAYAADVRSPGGAVGAERRRQADRVWKKWQAEDQAANLPARPSFQDELKKSKENTARLEAELRAEDEKKNGPMASAPAASTPSAPVEEPKIYLGRKTAKEEPKIYLGRKTAK